MISTEAFVSAEERAGALAERVFNAAIEVGELATIYLGDKLGFYRTLAELGEATPSQLASHAGTNERYTRE